MLEQDLGRLRQAAAADGKAEHNIMKLTLFRQFYIMVVTYIYFTRIIVFLLAATMPYDWVRRVIFCVFCACFACVFRMFFACFSGPLIDD